MDFTWQYWLTGLVLTAVLSLAHGLAMRQRYHKDERADIFAGDPTYRPLLISYCFVLGMAISEAWYHSPIDDGIPALFFTGLVTVIVARLLTSWAYKTLGRNYAPTAYNDDESHTLVKDGPYRYFRHPIYAGNFLFLVGVLQLAQAYTAWLAMLPYMLMLLWRVQVEEHHLDQKFKNV
ncbi:MAG TPA: isoprenylcysteine carboxylmethyltransferase family protein [bacterium]|nr:isoprenylcysteine carboxylmethyltransferase family protein [bacterium]